MNDETTPKIVPFETQAAAIENLNLQGCRSGNGLDPCALAVGLLTTHEWSGPWLTCYMLRRFGWPNIGSDDWKELMTWVLTTPIDGLFLTVTPYMGNDRDEVKTDQQGKIRGTCALHFGYLHTPEVGEERLNYYAPACRETMEARKAVVQQWWLETGNKRFCWAGCTAEEKETCVLEHHPEGKVLWGIYARSESLTTGIQNKEGTMTEAERELYFSAPLHPNVLGWMTQHLGLVIDTLDLTHDDDLFVPAKIGLDVANWPQVDWKRVNEETKQHEAEFLEPCREALRATLRDLLRPVYVRDVGFNALGRSDEYDDEDALAQPLPKVAQSFAGAGYTPEGWFEMQSSPENNP